MYKNTFYSLAICSLIFLTAGCGSSDSREYGTLSGKVTLNGQPAPKGTMISMVDLTSGAATSAQILDGGAYKFPRVQVGNYNVGFLPQGTSSSGTQETDPAKLNEMIAEGTYKPANLEKLIPLNLQNPENSGQKVTIIVGENAHDFAL